MASGPAWPEPIATRDASGVVTASSAISNGEPNSAAPGGEETSTAPDVVATESPSTVDVDENGGATPAKPADEPKAVVVSVTGGLERLDRKPSTPRVNGGGSNAGTGAATGGGDTSGGAPSGGGSTPAPSAPTPSAPPVNMDGLGPGSLAGGGSGVPNDDIEAGG